MSEVKRCVQCGILKEEEEFRKYTYSRVNDTEGRYRICKNCEAINTAYRRARQWIEDHSFASGEISLSGDSELAMYQKCKTAVTKTEQLYKLLESRGLRVPQNTREVEPDNLDYLLAFYKEPAVPVVTSQATDIPDELQHWLDADEQEWKDQNISPEFLQETIYESLKAKYRPQTGVNKDTFMPVYDDTYKTVLNQILRRFDDYEEECSLNDNIQNPENP